MHLEFGFDAVRGIANSEAKLTIKHGNVVALFWCCSFLSACAQHDDVAAEPLPKASSRSDGLYILESSLWPKRSSGETPITVCWSTGGFETEKQWVREAVEKTWAWFGHIQFREWNTCSSSYSGIRVTIADEGPHTAGLGTEIQNLNRGMVLNFSFLNWTPSCQGAQLKRCIQTVAVHEFGHALGFAHEQNRPDTPEWCREEQGTNGNVTVGDWDLYSVMNYCNPIWANNGTLSSTDVLGLWVYYNINPLFVASVSLVSTSML